MSASNSHLVDSVLSTSRVSEDEARELENALEEYLEQLEQGMVPDRSEFLGRYPGMRSLLQENLRKLELLHQTAFALSDDSRTSDSIEVGNGLRQLGDFRILEPIGRGGMGIVYEAEQMSLGRRVALKILPFVSMLDLRHLQRFKNEAQAAAILDHPNIVPIHSVGTERGIHYFAMKLIDGPNLSTLISQLGDDACSRRHTIDRPCDPRHMASIDRHESVDACRNNLEMKAETVAIASALTKTNEKSNDFYRQVAKLGVQAAEALDHAHEMGVIHRDIKPSNLLVDRSEKLWLSDFGLARVHGSQDLTVTGDVLGSLRYMSPEQALGRKTIDHRTDIYSLGVTLYELLTQQPAFRDTNRETLTRKIIDQDPVPPRKIDPEIPRDIETIVLKAISKEPSARYESAQQLANDLRQFTKQKPIVAKRSVLRQNKLSRWCRRYRVAILWLGVVFSLSLAFTFALVNRERLRANREAARSEEIVRELFGIVDASYPIDESNWHQEKLTARERQFLEGLLELYGERAARQRGSDVSSRLEAAENCRRIANIHWRLYRLEKGNQACRSAILILEDVVNRFPSSTRYRALLAETQTDLANGSASLVECRKAEVLNQALVADFPNERRFLLGLGRAHACTARAFKAKRQLAAAESHLRSAISFLTPPTTTPLLDEDSSVLIRLHESIGDIVVLSNRSTEAARQYQLALRLFEERPPTPESPLDNLVWTANIQGKYGTLLNRMRKPEEAQRQLQHSISNYREVLIQLPMNPWCITGLGASYLELCNAFSAMNQSGLAEDQLQLAMECFQRLGQYKDEIRRDRWLARIHYTRGQLQSFDGRVEEARSSFQIVNSYIESFLDKGIRNTSYLMDMAIFWTTCPDPSLRNPDRALEFANAIVDEGFGVHQQFLGLAQFRAGKPRSAIASFTKSTELRNGGDGFDFVFLAMAHWQVDEHEIAQRWFEKAVACAENEHPFGGHVFSHPLQLDALLAEAEQTMAQ